MDTILWMRTLGNRQSKREYLFSKIEVAIQDVLSQRFFGGLKVTGYPHCGIGGSRYLSHVTGHELALYGFGDTRSLRF